MNYGKIKDMKKYIFLDIDNTLLDFNKSSKESIIQGFDKFGLTYQNHIYDVFIEINDDLWEQIERKEIDKDTLYKIRWNLIFKELGIDFDGHIFEEYFIKSLDYIAVAVEGALELLEYLSKKYTVYLTSNAPYQQQITRLKIADMLKYVDKVYTSEKIGHSKPSKEFFDFCIQDLNIVDREEIVIIGDSYTADVQGGINSNIDTIWFDRTNKSRLDMQASYRVSFLHEILNIL